jgi:membrane protein implicated in regulation of membrane protease activity
MTGSEPLLVPIAWWLWRGGALALGLLALFIPGTIFLGFALGAAAMAVIAAFAPDFSGPPVLALFGFLSLLAWIVLRRVFRKQSSPTRIVTKDINDD